MSRPASIQTMSNAQKLRECMGRFATGVTVVTCTDAAGRHCGITANSFSSVSLEPPLVLWNIAKVSNSLEAYLNARYFAINVLADHQHDLSSHFAKSDHTLFDGMPKELSESGVPILPETLACLECRTHQIHDCGDHYIIVGEVERFRHSERAPLLFWCGRYAAMANDRRQEQS